jgi:hypothetical protein
MHDTNLSTRLKTVLKDLKDITDALEQKEFERTHSDSTPLPANDVQSQSPFDL